MEPITISLNTERQSMFFLPGKLHLTFEEPGPVELDPATLTEQEKGWINQAYITQVLFVDNPNKKNEVAKVDFEEIEKQARVPIDTPPRLDRREESTEEATEMLAQKPNAIKKSIAQSSDILVLRLAKEQEAKGKCRKGVIKAFDDRLGDLQSNLLTNIGGDQGEIGIHVTDASLRNLPEIDETVERSIKIKPMSEKDK